MNKISWPVDAEFMKQAEHRAVLADVVSFDIFDTAVTRLVDSPVDAFAEMEKRLIKRHHDVAPGFALEREQAEQRARYNASVVGKEDVTLDVIYAELSSVYFPIFIYDAKKTELEVERDLLVAVPEMLLLINRLHAQGKRIIFVSDMYLPSSFLYDVLVNLGYPATIPFVSGELGATKHAGSIWPLVKDSVGCAYYKILHIGDDGWSDGFCPTLIGIKSLVFERARTERRLGADLNHSVLPYSYLQRSITLGSRYATVTEEERWRNLGRSLGGIVLAAFVKWLHERAMTHNLNRLYFLARDGYLLHKAWKASGLGRNIDARYLRVSRRPLNMASGYLESTSRHFTPHLIQFVCGTDTNTTVRHLLERLHLKNEKIEQELIDIYGSLDNVIQSHELGSKPYEMLMRRNTDVLHEHLRTSYNSTVCFLEQEGLLEDKRIGIVDTGWNGSMQRFMNIILESTGRQTSKLKGFYCGLWNPCGINRHQAGLLESAFANPFALPSDAPEVALSVALIEELNGAPEGSTIGYYYDKVWSPICPSNSSEHDQYQDKIQYFQEGALEVVTSLFRTGSYRTLNLRDVTVDSAKAAMASVFLSPNQNELELLGSLGHCMMFEHSKFNPLVSKLPDTEEDATAVASTIEWWPGLFRSWQAQAETKEQRVLIQKLAKKYLSGYLNERQLRQFWV